MNNFLQELRCLIQIKATIAYLVVAWILLCFFTIFLPSDWIIKTLSLLFIFGFTIWITFPFIYRFVSNIIPTYTSGLLTNKPITFLPFVEMKSENDNQWFCNGFQKMFYLDIKPYEL